LWLLLISIVQTSNSNEATTLLDYDSYRRPSKSSVLMDLTATCVPAAPGSNVRFWGSPPAMEQHWILVLDMI
jgi:hypothetical protein